MYFRTLHRTILAAVLAAPLFALTAPAPVTAEEVGYWPEDKDDERLKDLDNDVLRLQEARFRALFAPNKDEKEVARLEKEFKAAQNTRRDLLRKTGRY